MKTFTPPPQSRSVGFALLLLILAFLGCKKNEFDEPLITSKSKIPEDVMNFIRNNSSTQSHFIINKMKKSPYTDEDGHIITSNSSSSTISTEATSCPEEWESEYTHGLVSVSSEYNCSEGYRYHFVYKFISEYNLVVERSSTQFSFVRIQLKDSYGNYYYTTPSNERRRINRITDNGVYDQNTMNIDRHEFLLEFTTEYFTYSDLEDAVAIIPQIVAYTDCTSGIGVTSLNTGFNEDASLPDLGNIIYGSACNRTDPVFITYSTSENEYYLTGPNPVLSNPCYSYYYDFPDEHEIEMKCPSGHWHDIPVKSNSTYTAPPIGVIKYLKYFDIYLIDKAKFSSNYHLTANTYVEFRFRNINDRAGSNECKSDWVYNMFYNN